MRMPAAEQPGTDVLNFKAAASSIIHAMNEAYIAGFVGNRRLPRYHSRED
jgi:hypothetical protein